MKKTLTLLLALLMCATAAMSACSDGKDTADGAKDTAAPGETTAAPAAEETTLVYKANLPEGTNYDGYDFRIMVNDSSQYWVDQNFTHEDENGNYINDAVLRRESSVEDITGCNIEIIPQANVSSTTTKFVSTDDDAADMVWIAPVVANSPVTQGTFVELNTIPTLDLTNPWWDQNAAKGLSIGNKLYMMYGDISMMYKRTMSVVIFNKSLVSDLSLESPYDYVNGNNWTIEAMATISKDVAEDLNNDGYYKIKEDRLAAALTTDQLPILLLSHGASITKKDADDIPVVDFYDDHMIDAFSKITSFIFNEDLVSISDSGSNTDSFGQSLLLFQFCEMHCIPHQREMDDDFGILPFPKYDSEQERYYHVINPNVACAMLIPVTNRDLERTGYIAEVLGAEGKNKVTPAYYDFNLTARDTRDEESVAMLDLIFASTYYDVAHIYDIGGIGSTLRGVAQGKNENITSVYESKKKSLEKNLEKTVEKYLDIES